MGRRIAEVCDVAVLIGEKRTAPLRRGLKENGFGGETHIFRTLSEAEGKFPELLHLGDVLLLLNDLPDNYSE